MKYRAPGREDDCLARSGQDSPWVFTSGSAAAGRGSAVCQLAIEAPCAEKGKFTLRASAAHRRLAGATQLVDKRLIRQQRCRACVVPSKVHGRVHLASAVRVS